MGDKGKKEKDKHNKQIVIAKNEADKIREDRTRKNIKPTLNFGK